MHSSFSEHGEPVLWLEERCEDRAVATDAAWMGPAEYSGISGDTDGDLVASGESDGEKLGDMAAA